MSRTAPLPSRGADRGRGAQARLGLLLLVGFVVYFATLDARGYWADEVWGLWDVRHDLPHLLKARARAGHHPFYFLVLWTQVRLFGEGEVVTRLPALLASFGSVSFLYAIVRRVTASPRAALLAAALLLLTPAHLRYAQEARMYAFVECFSLAGTWVLLASGPRPGIGAAWAFAALTAANLFTHASAQLVVVAQVAFLLTRRRIPWRLLVATSFALVPFGLWLLYFLPRFDPAAYLGWQPEWEPVLVACGLGWALLPESCTWVSAVAGIAALGLGVAGAVAAGARGAALTWLAFGVVAAGVLVSALGFVNAFCTPRYLLAAWAALVGLWAVATHAVASWHKTTGIVLAGSLLLSVAVGLVCTVRADPRFDAREAARVASRYEQEGDDVVLLGGLMSQTSFRWYREPAGSFYWVDPTKPAGGTRFVDPATTDYPAERPLPAGIERLWVVLVEDEHHYRDSGGVAEARLGIWRVIRARFSTAERVAEVEHASLWLLRSP